jgi:peptidyl-prolyl cis-trans isomerase B (cyclophilin B)
MGVDVKLENQRVALGDTVRAIVTISNDGDLPARMPLPVLALPSVSLHFLRKPDASNPESFITRIGDEPEQVEIAPGSSVSGVIEFPAVEAGELAVTALYRPTGRIHPHFAGTEVERSAPATLTVEGGGATLHARIKTEAGLITLEFFPGIALNHVSSFVELARRGYYNGIKFHRVVPDFVIQGGDPTGTGSGGPGYRLPAEFSNVPHKPGILSMARTQDPHSAGSQFFICTADCPNLDQNYTVFGRVIDGLKAVLQIGESSENAGRFTMQSVEIVVE